MSHLKYANIIKRADEAAWFRRVMWSSLDDRIKTVFDEFSSENHKLSLFGGIRLSRAKDSEPIRSSGLLSFQVTNSTHIHTGRRFLGTSITNVENQKLEIAEEWNCQLWYAQSPFGEVLVLLAPYQSNAGKIHEKEIIIGKFKEPAQITANIIHKHFNTFFRYCASTSQNNAGNWHNYLYRQYLIYKDFRYTASYKAKFFRLIERIAILLLGGAAVWAALYAGGKI